MKYAVRFKGTVVALFENKELATIFGTVLNAGTDFEPVEIIDLTTATITEKM